MTATTVPASITDALSLAHVSWHPILLRGLHAMMAADAAFVALNEGRQADELSDYPIAFKQILAA